MKRLTVLTLIAALAFWCNTSRADVDCTGTVTADAAKQMYAAALVALTTDLLIFVVYDDATSSCFINRLQVYKG